MSDRDLTTGTITAWTVRSRALTYYDGVIAGRYRPLGTGDLDLAAIVDTLQRNGSVAGTPASRTPC